MKSVTKYIFSRRAPKQFVGVRIPEGQVEEKVILKTGTIETDITRNHSIVCQTPMHIAVLVSNNRLQLSGSEEYEVWVVNGQDKISLTRVTLIHEVYTGDATVFLFKAEEASYFKLNSIYQNILLKRFDNRDGHTFPELKIQLALYCYPRGINIISFKDNDYYNIFPMNFQRCIDDSGIHLFGLRTTNITLNKILSEKKIVVSDPGGVDFKTIYALGSHNSKSPPVIDDLPFTTTESELFKFPIPDFAIAYKEIEIITSFLLGSHMFFVGRVINEKKIKEKTSSVYNVHFFPFMRSNYKEED